MRKINLDTVFDAPEGQIYSAVVKYENTSAPETYSNSDVLDATISVRIGTRKTLTIAYDVKASQRRRANRIANSGVASAKTYIE